MGFEPHDLRVMSPTSYQAALPRDIKFLAEENGAGSRDRTGTRNKSHGILSPGRLPIPPFRHVRPDGLLLCLSIIAQSFCFVKPFSEISFDLIRFSIDFGWFLPDFLGIIIVFSSKIRSSPWHRGKNMISYIGAILKYMQESFKYALPCERKSKQGISNTFQNHNLIVIYNPKGCNEISRQRRGYPHSSLAS